MKRLLLAVGVVVATAGTAFAGDFLGVNLGFPYYFYPSAAPAPRPDDRPVPQTAPGSFHYAPPQVYREPGGARTLVEEIYRDGRLVERRVKYYPADWAGYKKAD